ncbi:lysophospholipid acyltransferase family protein [Rhodohalobacter mucosus]|uniref:1-acyl-sn-glycerol-3-phosphate acyltransferase n=1 Tax=Rhodohalobacter mucosus TaxID=2079485 RepID=A0A316TRI0_9BACT|nr:lysophospholipid acyltransferase family protein [Rhodohalobacter mucosus]PWN07030.1 1-acyl-sn-glycerol-3-phosphate acyltransferase [Rhodohalobacter mucosus]
MQQVKSFFIWAAIVLLIVFWVPLLAVRRLFDREPTHYKTGRLFRKLGHTISRINPNWHIRVEGRTDLDDRHPYVVVSNHLSNADIPVISNLPWEMKWVAKKELFSLPFAGWMMRMAGDISVDRSSATKRVGVFKKCSYYLSRNVSVMFFPEGTRSRSGKLNRFAPGAFDLAIRENVPVVPIVLDGTRECLPKNTWIFKPGVEVRMKILDPVPVEGFGEKDGKELMNTVRQMIASQLAEWRNESVEKVLG